MYRYDIASIFMNFHVLELIFNNCLKRKQENNYLRNNCSRNNDAPVIHQGINSQTCPAEEGLFLKGTECVESSMRDPKIRGSKAR